MNDTIVEIRIKEKNQRVAWEQLPVMRCVYASELSDAVKWFDRLYQYAELRWNYQGKLQGHYVPGNISRYG